MSKPLQVKSDFVEVPGARLYYELAGEGEPIVFLHGGLLDGRMWDEQFQFFAQHYQVIRYDMRRSGKSEDVAASGGPVTPYQDLYHVLNVLSLQQATLVGLSGGARFAIDLALAYPTMVQRLVTVSAGLSGYEFVDEWTKQHNGIFTQAIGRGDLPAAVEEALTLWAYGPYRGPEQIPAPVREQMREMVTCALSKGILLIMGQMRELDPPAITRLSQIAAPTLIVLGEKDTSDIHKIGRLLREQIIGSELEMIPETAHPLTMEKPQEFNQLLLQFLQRR